jgi:NAD+ synthase
MGDGFRDRQKLHRALSLMQGRHVGGYQTLVDRICEDLASYWKTQCELEQRLVRLMVALSGGLDSSVTTSLAVRAVGPENVRALTMPARPDDLASVELSKLLCMSLRVELLAVPIVDVVESEICAVNRAVTPELRIEAGGADRIRLGNLASRTRVLVLYDLARSLPARVLGTSNRTEFLLGYAAKFGTPMSYDLGVLDCLYKSEVRGVAQLLSVPVRILEAASTTGYYQGQTHEEELGAVYEDLDAACFLLFERGISPQTLVADWSATPELASIVTSRYERAGHKRRLHPDHLELSWLQHD